MLRRFTFIIVIFALPSSIFAEEKITHLLCKACNGSSDSFTIEEIQKTILTGQMKGYKTVGHLIGIGSDNFMGKSNYKISCGVEFNPSNMKEVDINTIRCHTSKLLDQPPAAFGSTPLGQKGKRNRVININKIMGSYSDLVYDEVDYYSALYYHPDILHKFPTRLIGLGAPNEIHTKVLSYLQGVCEKRTGSLF